MIKKCKQWWIAACIVSVILPISYAQADPCGMVPPAYVGGGPAIKRVGAQKTYVFYRKGMESIVLRPGFSGKVDNFGMLIPFPSPPAIRKVPDEIFSQITSAIDPPEVVVRIWRRRRWGRRFRRLAKSAPAKRASKPALRVNSVKVLNQEAVGMYQVAVLQAGSPKALKRWMGKHGYRYPKGMDKVTYDYIKARWTFVAVKARVAGKKGVKARPGMRKAKLRFPPGGSFDGKVQAMGFRFYTKKLVVPMRLSAFNAGKLRNIVYLLTTGPKRIRNIPKKYVRRQLSGRQLYNNLTGPLPMRIYGGTVSQIKSWQWPGIQNRRKPKRFNGLARVLFATDLYASKKRKLFLEHEEEKKVLLRIGERLGLRGKHLDKMHRAALSEKREAIARKALHLLKRMTLTIVDGDFARQVIARENLTFVNYRMPRHKNSRLVYNARMKGIQKKGYGIRSTWVGPIKYRKVFRKKPPKRRALVKLNYRKKNKGGNKYYKLIDQLTHPKKVNAAIRSLVAQKSKSMPYLLGEALEGLNLVKRGWSLVALSEIGSNKYNKQLQKLYNNYKEHILVRTWAAATEISFLTKADELLRMARLIYQMRPIQRPIAKRILQNTQGKLTSKKLLKIANSIPALRKALAPMIIRNFQKENKSGLAGLFQLASHHYWLRQPLGKIVMGYDPKALVKVMVKGQTNTVRWHAASYVGAHGRTDPIGVSNAVIAIYRFSPKAKQVPWKGGALYVPGIQWPRKKARTLVRNLIAWYVWCDHRQKSNQQRQIHNNLRSLGLAQMAGYRSPGWRQSSAESWLRALFQFGGYNSVYTLLKRQNLHNSSKYKPLLTSLRQQPKRP